VRAAPPAPARRGRSTATNRSSPPPGGFTRAGRHPREPETTPTSGLETLPKGDARRPRRGFSHGSSSTDTSSRRCAYLSCHDVKRGAAGLVGRSAGPPSGRRSADERGLLDGPDVGIMFRDLAVAAGSLGLRRSLSRRPGPRHLGPPSRPTRIGPKTSRSGSKSVQEGEGGG